jgi:heptosyltransferase III
MKANPGKILVHRLGSLGDTLITLPIFHLLERQWPNAEKRVLTNSPINAKAPPLWSVLGENNFIDGHFSYTVGTRNIASLWSLISDIRRWGPDIIVYANPIYSRSVLYRDRVFLGLCGADEILGLDASNVLERQPIGLERGRVPSMASRIFEGLSDLGDFEIDNPANWSLRLTAPEHETATQALASWDGRDEFVAFSIGTKWPENDWGDVNWHRVFEIVSDRKPGVGLIAVGAPGERERSAQLLAAWRGPTLNLCGSVSPRESAALIGRASCFAGHDSGPMHLSAAVRTPSVTVFSLKNPPGLWFPYGKDNRIFYPGLSWSGGNPEVTRDAAGESELSTISADAVAGACVELLNAAKRG